MTSLTVLTKLVKYVVKALFADLEAIYGDRSPIRLALRIRSGAGNSRERRCPRGRRNDSSDTQLPLRRGPSSTAIPSVRRLLSNQLPHGFVAGHETRLPGVKLQFRTPLGPNCFGSLGQLPAGVVTPSWCSR